MTRAAQYRVHPDGGPAVDRIVSIDSDDPPDYLMFIDDPGIAWKRIDRACSADPEYIATPFSFGPDFDDLVTTISRRIWSTDDAHRLSVGGWNPEMVSALIRSYLTDEVLEGLMMGWPILEGSEA